MPRRLRPLLSALVLLVLSATLSACKAEPRTMVVEIDVQGMTCDSCVQAITHEVGLLEGVNNVAVDLEGHKATVTFTEGAVELAAIEQTIERIGYEAEPGTPEPVLPGE
ncbi:MAG: heavy-metal-associated domain-containing protein [Myxococcales bacterium]|nr:heavy-metal-associated domain-containing protein [Myxococcales bacterium]